MVKELFLKSFFDDQHIGGYDEARALEKENKVTRTFKIKLIFRLKS